MKRLTPDHLIIPSAVGIISASFTESVASACILAIIMAVGCWSLAGKRGGG